MGKTQGVFSGDPETNYDRGPAAIVTNKKTTSRKLTDHTFAGPDHSIVHPGIFPHNPQAAETATLDEWVTFDYRAGWGTDEFEDDVAEDHAFPDRWSDIDDRYDAREILDQQIALLNAYMTKRAEVLRNGIQIGDIVTDQADQGGIKFRVQVRNVTDGHTTSPRALTRSD